MTRADAPAADRVVRDEPPRQGDVILRLRAVVARVGFGRSTIYKLIAKREFPAALRLSDGLVGWRASDIDQWIASRINHTEAARR